MLGIFRLAASGFFGFRLTKLLGEPIGLGTDSLGQGLCGFRSDRAVFLLNARLFLKIFDGVSLAAGKIPVLIDWLRKLVPFIEQFLDVLTNFPFDPLSHGAIIAVELQYFSTLKPQHTHSLS